MSFEDYAEHIYQKYRLCTAIAVLKTKPSNITTMEYIEQLKSNLTDKMDEDDVTVCSDDFIMDDDDDDDSVNILKDFNDVLNDGGMNNGGEQISVQLPQDQSTYIEDSVSQSMPNDNQQYTYVPYYESDHNYYSKQNINEANDKNNAAKENETIFKEDFQINTNIDVKSSNKASKNPYVDASTKIDDPNSKQLYNSELNLIADSNNDSQKTVFYTVHGFTDNYTHYSPSQNDMVIPNNYLYAGNKNQPEKTIKNVTKTKDMTNEAVSSNTDKNSNTNLNSNENCFANKTVPNKNVLPNNEYEEMQNLNLFSQNIDEVFSQNQNDLQRTLTSKDNLTTNNENKNNRLPILTNLQHSQCINDYFNEINNYNNINNIIGKVPNTDLDKTDKIEENNINLSQNIDCNSQTTYLTNKTVATGNNTNELNENFDNPIQNFGPNIENFEQNNNRIAGIEMVEEELDSVEVIPYKVLEELNKIKMFLRRRDRRMSCDGYSTDSGYRSDSQIRSSNRSALQLSGPSVNQSAHCLFNHIMQCPLVVTTRDITSEIANSLGELIDKLHEEETYPPFLEELLDTIDILLRQVFRGQGSDDYEFLKKEEFIQRIILLNKSIHIQKHTIEKITEMMSKFYEKVTDNNDTYELTNIDEVENVSYIFHILELLLKKYIKNKDNLSQGSTQMSQDEDKILKKSSITDIWRKKWNPNLKNLNEGRSETRCVLKECSEILNKIVVDCVNSYSLIAFSALKCFNSMQS